MVMQRLLSIVDKQLKLASVTRRHPSVTGDASDLYDNLCYTMTSDHQTEGNSNSIGYQVIL